MNLTFSTTGGISFPSTISDVNYFSSDPTMTLSESNPSNICPLVPSAECRVGLAGTAQDDSAGHVTEQLSYLCQSAAGSIASPPSAPGNFRLDPRIPRSGPGRLDRLFLCCRRPRQTCREARGGAQRSCWEDEHGGRLGLARERLKATAISTSGVVVSTRYVFGLASGSWQDQNLML